MKAPAILCVYQPAITTPLSLIGHIRGGRGQAGPARGPPGEGEVAPIDSDQ